jgi:hypothetical protein
MRTLTSRTITTATAAVFALTIMSLQPAAAHDRSGDAAALAAFAAIFGTVAAIIATQQYESRYAYDPRDHGPGPRGYWHHRHHR